MSSECDSGVEGQPAIRVRGLSKIYQIYAQPEDRLKQVVLPRMHRLLGRPSSRYYHEFWALRNVSFDVLKGETLGIIGRNGSGKSTLLQIICGTLTPTSGDVEVKGRVAALLELGSGFNPEFTGRENIYMSGAVLGLTRDQVAERFDDIIAFADIGEFIGQPVKTYSSGMYVRLAFAVIAHADADILIIDEALSVGDMVFTQKCMRFLRTFRERGTLIFVSHDLASVLNMCQTVVWLQEGCMKMQGGAKAVTDAYSLDCFEAAAGQGIQFELISGADEAISADNQSIEKQTQLSFFDNISNAKGWTTHKAHLVSITINDDQGRACATFSGGENVVLTIRAQAQASLESPIIGFLVKDRLGQSLFGQHTFDTASMQSVAAGATIVARFAFSLPLLQNGEYAVTASIADGTPEAHVQHHWLHDALIIRVASAQERHGLVGIPFKHVSLKAEPEQR